MALKFYTSAVKRLKIKVRKICWLIPRRVEVTGEKLPPSCIGLTRNIRNLNVKNADIEALCKEIINKKPKNILIKNQYRQPAANFNELESQLNIFLAKSKPTDKICFLVRDLNLEY